MSRKEIKELKAYLGIEGSHNDSLLFAFMKSAKELVEKILRYEISKLEIIPDTISEAIRYAVGYLYTNREQADYLQLERMLSVILSAHRKGAF